MINKKRMHFGVLLTTIDNSYLFSIWKGIYEYAKMNDIHLTAYFGSYQSSDDDVAVHIETCFNAIKNSSIDGVILFSGLLAKHIGINRINEFISELPENMPVVSVSFPMQDVTSVLVDNIAGVYGAVEHLINVHGKSKIAFIKGPDEHLEAIDRLTGYKNALAANGIALDERYILPGNFSRASGRSAIRELFDIRKITADAIVSSDDETAIGVLGALKDRKIAVPADIAVIGFNDDRASANFIPSMSTVRQGYLDIGMVSAEAIHRKIKGEQTEDIKYVAPVFVPRQSCGCYEKSYSHRGTKPENIPTVGDTFTSYTIRNITHIFQHSVPKQLIHKWVTDLVNMLMEKPFTRDKFLHMFDDILVNYINYSTDFSLWYEALNILSSGIDYYADMVDYSPAIQSTLFYATTRVYDIRLRDEKTKEFYLSDTRVTLRRIVNSIIAKFDVDSLSEELHSLFPELSLNMVLIGLYPAPVMSNDPIADRSIETLIGFDGDNKITRSPEDNGTILFSDYSSIGNFDFEHERRTLFFIPLYFEDEEAGVLLISYETETPVETYETLRINISTAIKGAELVSKIQTLSITDALTGLYNRRGFFQFAFSRLNSLSRNSEAVPIVLIMDLDGLKYINDTYGHKEGDNAIIAFANLLKETLRKDDIIGRHGGDEFVVFSSVRPDESGEQIVNRIKEKLAEYNSTKIHPYDISVSIGSVVLSDTTNECFETALHNADNVLYDEKTEKRNKGLTR